MYNIGVNQPTEDFEHTYIENLSNSKCNLIQVDSENMDAIISNLDGVFLKEDTNQNIGKICGLIMKIKEKSNPLIWVFSEEPSSIQKIIYLQMGADGAFTGEDEPEAINLIINNSLKRYYQEKQVEVIEKPAEHIHGIELIPHNLSIKFSDSTEEIALTRLEFQLMQLLCNNYLKGVSYQEIHEHIWQKPYKNNKYKVANLVFHLRSKLEKSGVEPTLIRTVRSKGYMLSEA